MLVSIIVYVRGMHIGLVFKQRKESSLVNIVDAVRRGFHWIADH